METVRKPMRHSKFVVEHPDLADAPVTVTITFPSYRALHVAEFNVPEPVGMTGQPIEPMRQLKLALKRAMWDHRLLADGDNSE